MTVEEIEEFKSLVQMSHASASNSAPLLKKVLSYLENLEKECAKLQVQNNGLKQNRELCVLCQINLDEKTEPLISLQNDAANKKKALERILYLSFLSYSSLTEISEVAKEGLRT